MSHLQHKSASWALLAFGVVSPRFHDGAHWMQDRSPEKHVCGVLPDEPANRNPRAQDRLHLDHLQWCGAHRHGRPRE